MALAHNSSKSFAWRRQARSAASGSIAAVCPANSPAPGIDNSGAVDFNDILSLLAAWGCGTCEDIDNNGTVDFADLLGVLAAYGDC